MSSQGWASPPSAVTTFWRAAALSLAGVPASVVSSAVGLYLPLHFGRGMGLPMALITAITALSTLAVAGVELAGGVAMDRTSTALGRYRLWAVFGALSALAGCFLLVTARAGVAAPILFVSAVLATGGAALMSLALVAWAQGLDLGYGRRRMVFGVIPIMPVVAAWMFRPITYLFEQGGRPALSVAGPVLLVVALAIGVAIAFAPERFDSKARRSALGDDISALFRPSALRLMGANLLLVLGPGVAATLGLYVWIGLGVNSAFIGILAFAAAVGAALGAPFWGFIAAPTKSRVLAYSAGLYAAAQVLTFLTASAGGFGLLALWLFLQGFAAMGFSVVLRAMAGDVCDEITAERGGMHYAGVMAVLNMVGRVAGVGATLLVGLILTVLRVNARHPDPETTHTLLLIYALASAAAGVLGAAVLVGFKPGPKEHAETLAKLGEGESNVADVFH